MKEYQLAGSVGLVKGDYNHKGLFKLWKSQVLGCSCETVVQPSTDTSMLQMRLCSV